MSFLIDPALLYAGGRSYGQLTRETEDPARDARFVAGNLALFWGVSIPLYLDQRWTRPLWKPLRAGSGRDWMLNSGLLRLDVGQAGRRTHVLAALIFLTYPYWLWRGIRAGRRA